MFLEWQARTLGTHVTGVVSDGALGTQHTRQQFEEGSKLGDSPQLSLALCVVDDPEGKVSQVRTEMIIPDLAALHTK